MPEDPVPVTPETPVSPISSLSSQDLSNDMESNPESPTIPRPRSRPPLEYSFSKLSLKSGRSGSVSSITVNVTDEDVDLLRRQFIKEYEDNKDLYHRDDVERIKDEEEPWHVARFLLLCKGNLDQAFTLMKQTMQWRMEYGVNELKASDFPKEFFAAGCLHRCGKDKLGRDIVHVRGEVYQRIEEIVPVMKKFFVYRCNIWDLEAGANGVMVIFDMSNTGIRNVDLEVMKFVVGLRDYFPKAPRCVLVYGLPWILIPFLRIVISWLPEEYRRLIKVGNKDVLDALVNSDQLPDYMEGTCSDNYREVPQGALTTEEAAIKYSVNLRSLDKYSRVLDPYLPPQYKIRKPTLNRQATSFF